MEEYRYTLLTTNQSGVEMYGIAAVDEKNGVQNILEEIVDIGINRKTIIRLIERCNKYQLSPCHLTDAVYDFLGE